MVFFFFAHLEVFTAGRCNGIARYNRFLKQHIHKDEHRFGLQNKSARRLGVRGIEVLVNAIVVHNRDIPGLPVIPDIVVNLVSLAVEDVERSFVHMAVLLASAAWPVFFQMQVKQLADAVLGFDIVTGIRLWAVDRT